MNFSEKDSKTGESFNITTLTDKNIDTKYIFSYLMPLVLFISSVISALLLGFSLNIGLDILLLAGKSALMNTIFFFTIIFTSMLSPLLLPISHKRQKLLNEVDGCKRKISFIQELSGIILTGSQFNLSLDKIKEEKKGLKTLWYSFRKIKFNKINTKDKKDSDYSGNAISYNLKHYDNNPNEWENLDISYKVEIIGQELVYPSADLFNKSKEKNDKTVDNYQQAEKLWGNFNREEYPNLLKNYKKEILHFIISNPYKNLTESINSKGNSEKYLFRLKIIIIFLYVSVISVFLLGIPNGLYVSGVLGVLIFLTYKLDLHYQLALTILIACLLGYFIGFSLKNSTSRSLVSLEGNVKFYGSIFLSTSTGFFAFREELKEIQDRKKNEKYVVFIPWERVKEIQLK